MSEHAKSGNVVWAALSALGGLLGGAASVIGLFMAKPDTITVFVPVQRLEQVVNNAAQVPASLEAEPAPSGHAPAAAPAVLAWNAPRALGGALSVTLVSMAEAQEHFVVSIRFTNSGAVEQRVALRGPNGHSADANLTDGFGGSCPLRHDNVDSFGTMQSVPGQVNAAQAATAYAAAFTPVPAGGSVVQTLIFVKSKCDSPASGAHPLSASATFMVLEGEVVRTAAASFESAPVAQAPN